MSAKAKIRIAAQKAAEEAEQLAGWKAEAAEQERREEDQRRAAYEAGPPCADCYVFVRHVLGGGWGWAHRWVETDDDLCPHDCHEDGDRYFPVIALA